MRLIEISPKRFIQVEQIKKVELLKLTNYKNENEVTYCWKFVIGDIPEEGIAYSRYFQTSEEAVNWFKEKLEEYIT